MNPPHLDAGPEDTKDLDLVFWDGLSEGNQKAILQSHLSVILNPKTGGSCQPLFARGKGPHVRERRSLEYEVFDPAQTKGDNIGDHDSNRNEFYCFGRPP